MPWIDATTGAVIPDDKIHRNAKAKFAPYPVQTPEQVGARLKGIAERNIAPIAGQLVGQGLGELAGAALAPETGGLSEVIPLVLGAIGSGAANVATNKLPPKLGGNPNESKTSSFLWGAVPAVVGGAVPRSVSAVLGRKAATGAEEAAKTFEEQAGEEAERQREIVEDAIRGQPATQATIKNIGHTLGSVTGEAAAPLEGEARTKATDTAADLVLGPINRMRRRLGEPIGQAYESLKGNETRLSPEQTTNLTKAAQGVKDSLIAPSPKANAIFARIKNYIPEPEAVNMDSTDAIIELPGGEIIQRPVRPETTATQLEDLRPEQIKKLQVIEKSSLGHEEKAELMHKVLAEFTEPQAKKPPTLDELRELRQRVNQALRTASGGDVHALLNLQGALDAQLMEHLPVDIGGLRKSYRGFIKNYPWQELNKLRASGTPEDVGNWLFSQDPSVINEVIHEAKPAERDGYQQLFAQRVLSKVDPDLPVDAQKAQIAKELRPYVKNGSVRALYGAQAENKLREMLYLPARRAEIAKQLASPEGRKIWNEGFMNEARSSSKADQKAAEAGFNAWLNMLPPEQQEVVRRFVNPSEPNKEIPVLPSSREVLSGKLKPAYNKIRLSPWMMAYLAGNLGVGLFGGRGSSHYAQILLAGFPAILLGRAGYKAMMDKGGADLLAKIYESPNARRAGAALFRALVTMGTRALHQEAQPDNATR